MTTDAVPPVCIDESSSRVAGAWQVVTKFDPRCCALRDRHYPPRRKVGSRQFLPPGETLALLLEHRTGLAVWGVCLNRFRGAWRWRCTIFRNESRLLSSGLIREATALTLVRWRDAPWPLRTEVDASRTRPKQHPGRCFLAAGWSLVGITPAGHGRPALHVFQAPVLEPKPGPTPQSCGAGAP